MKSHKDISFSVEIINILDTIERSNSRKKDNISFNNNIYEFRNKMMKLERFKKNSNQMIPKWIFYEIFSNFNKDFINNDILWENNIVSQIKNNPFPSIYANIEQFKERYRNIFVDNFYFLLLTLINCPRCNNLLNIDIGVSSLFSLDGNISSNVSSLIERELFSDDNNLYYNNNYYCSICNINTFGKSRKKFFTTPQFLLIDFYGEKKTKKYLDDEINLTPYSLENEGPKKYALFAFIYEDQNSDYIAYIKNEFFWMKYTKDTRVEPYNISSSDTFCPHIAIYKGI